MKSPRRRIEARQLQLYLIETAPAKAQAPQNGDRKHDPKRFIKVSRIVFLQDADEITRGHGLGNTVAEVEPEPRTSDRC